MESYKELQTKYREAVNSIKGLLIITPETVEYLTFSPHGFYEINKKTLKLPTLYEEEKRRLRNEDYNDVETYYLLARLHLIPQREKIEEKLNKVFYKEKIELNEKYFEETVHKIPLYYFIISVDWNKEEIYVGIGDRTNTCAFHLYKSAKSHTPFKKIATLLNGEDKLAIPNVNIIDFNEKTYYIHGGVDPYNKSFEIVIKDTRNDLIIRKELKELKNTRLRKFYVGNVLSPTHFHLITLHCSGEINIHELKFEHPSKNQHYSLTPLHKIELPQIYNIAVITSQKLHNYLEKRFNNDQH